MKNSKKLVLIGLVALIAIFGITACGGDDGDGGGNNGGNGGGGDFTPEYAIGDTGTGGGIVFYVSTKGFTMTDTNEVCHYLEASPEDMATKLAWASGAFLPPVYDGGTGDWVDITGTGTAIGTGRKNTALILATDADAPAAKACNEYTNNGKFDWFLPSKDELNQLYVNRTHVGNLQTSENIYRSSSQYSRDSAWYQRFINGEQRADFNSKRITYTARAVRAF